MKIEDIKPGDVIVRTEDGMVNKVAEVTTDGLILRSAYTDMAKCFHVFLNPDSSKLTADHYEPATDDQRQYIDSKLADFYGTNAEAASKRITALATMMGDLKQENIELAERMKQLTDDNNRMAKRIDSARTLSDLTAALDKVEELERDRDFFKKEYKQGQRLYESLFNQHDLQSNELKAVREERDDAKEQYNELQHKYEELQKQFDTVKSDIQRFVDERNLALVSCSKHREANYFSEKRIKRFLGSSFIRKELDCPHGVKAQVGSLGCFICEHYIKSDSGNTETVLCAHDYDKQEENNKK